MVRTTYKHGFTIVELLIVIVVIGILAAITIVAYNGVQKRAGDAAVKSEVVSALKQIKVFATTNSDIFPTTIASCPTPTVGAACVLGGSKNALVYAQTSDAPRSFCFSGTNTSGSSYYVTETGIVSPGSCSLHSCYEIQQAGGSTGSGRYWIQPTGVASPVPVYCDMDTAGGGWTLIISNPGPATSWNATNVYSQNTTVPSINSLYSILSLANGIKSNIGGNVNYMIDAGSRGHWGGVWTAPYSVDLQATSPQNSATLTQQFDSWTQDTNATDSNGTQTLSNVVPWVSSTSGSLGLTTWGGVGNWYGTLVTYAGWSPAPYINPGQINPGVVWYWIR